MREGCWRENSRSRRWWFPPRHGCLLRRSALGATAVGIGRPYVWGLAAFGQSGVVRVMDILRAELAIDMGMAGTGKNLGDKSLVRPHSFMMVRSRGRLIFVAAIGLMCGLADDDAGKILRPANNSFP